MVRNYQRKTEARPWTRDDLLEALMCIKAGKLEVKDAARQYGISKATLYRQYQKFELAGGICDVSQFRTCGAQPILKKLEENVLVKTIRDLREQGFTVTSSDIKRICFEYCASQGIPNQFNQETRRASDDWYYGFSKRHPDLNILKPVEAGASITSSASFTSPDKLPTQKETMNPDRIPPTAPVHVLTTKPSKVTSGKGVKQSMEVVGAALNGRKQNDGSVAAAPLKKPLKRLILTEPGVARGKKGKAIHSHIPTDEEEEIDSEDLEEDYEDERDKNIGEDDLEEVMQTDDKDEDNKNEEVEDEVEMDTDDEEPDEADKSDSDEEENEEGVTDDDDDEEGEVSEQEDSDEDEEEEEEDEEGDDGDGEQENDPDSALIISCDVSPKSKKLKLTPPQNELNQKQDDIGEVMQAETADVDDKDEEEHEDEEAVERCAQRENEDEEQEVEDEVDMDEDDEEQDETETSDSEEDVVKMDDDDEEQDETETSDSEEEEVEEEEAEGDDDEEEEVQEDDDDGGEKEEGEGDVDEEEDGPVVVTGKDDVVYDACM